MAVAIDLISATVKYPSDKIFDTDRGPRRKLVFEVPGDADPVTVWGQASDPAFTQLKKGQPAQLLVTGTNQKGEPIYKIVLPDPDHTEKLGTTNPSSSSAPSGPHPSDRWSAANKRAIAEEVKQRAGLLGYCHAQVAEQFTNKSDGTLLIERYTLALYSDLMD